MNTQLIPVGQEWTDIKNMAQVLVGSGFLPKSVDTPQKGAAIMLMGREIGIGPMEAFSKISVIQGKPTIGAELMKAMVHKKLPTATFRLVSSDDKHCTFAAGRPGDKATEFSYTLEEAKAMGLVNKDNWKKMPKVMLRWRCISEVCRTVFPDCLSGISYTPEELGAAVNESGEVIEAEVKKPELPSGMKIPEENKGSDHPYEKKSMRDSPISTAPQNEILASKPQVLWIEANTGKDKTYSREEIKEYVRIKYGKAHFHDLNRSEYDELRKAIEAEDIEPAPLDELTDRDLL